MWIKVLGEKAHGGEVGLALSLKSARNVAGRGEEVSTPDFPSRP